MKNYFTDDELKCKCCGALVFDKDFRYKLNLARTVAGFPFIVGSGYRCPKHNKEVKSTSDNHVVGKAVDILCDDPGKRYWLLNALVIAGILGIGAGPTFVHGDSNRTEPVLFTY
jgi:zinc D-Ala-D-Ala carboxypeptidase